MNTQTSLVAEQVRLQQWAEQIKDCQNRPADMKVETWCAGQGLTKACYYYRLRRVREAFLAASPKDALFVELPVPVAINSNGAMPIPSTAAILRGPQGITLEILNGASSDLIKNAIGAFTYAQ